MNTETWALVVFTILAQMSVGSFLILGVVHFFADRSAGAEQADMLSDRALIGILVSLGLGFIASFFHLGSPLTAYKAINNFGSSWLSREITFGVAFAVVGAIFVILQWRKAGSPTIRNVVALVAGIIGLAFVFSMSNVYMLETQLAWNTLITPISFFTTTFLLGSLALAAALVYNYGVIRRTAPDCEEIQCSLLRTALRWIAIASVVLLGVELVVGALNAAFIASVQNAGSMDFLNDFGVLFAVRLTLVFVGAGVFALFLYQNAMSPGQEKNMTNYAYTAFGFVLVAEVLNRFLFYATQIQQGF
jgi:anaerobic dimethyl sulfoxide reductase subunit C (anchor subunit)